MNDFRTKQNSHHQNLISMLLKYSASEISAFDLELPKFENFNLLMQEELQSVIKQYKEIKPCCDPQFYTNKLENDFMKKSSVKSVPNMVKFYQQLINDAKWKSKTVFNRLNKPITLPEFSNYFPLFSKSISEHLGNCELAKQSLQSQNMTTEFVETVIKYEFYKHFCNFQIDNFFYLFKRFPLLRRKEIFKKATERLIHDLMLDFNPASVPTVIDTQDGLFNELRRLANVLNIEFDIDSHDGQHFSYSCEKNYYECLSRVIVFELFDEKNRTPMVENPDFIDRLNYIFLENIEIEKGILFSFENLIKPDDENMNTIIKKFSYGMIKELTSDKVTALLRLQFTRNKRLIHSIVDSIKKIELLRNVILDINEQNFFDSHFNIFRKTTLCIASFVKKEVSAKGLSIDNESLLEILLDLYDQFYTEKVNILNSFREIQINTPNIEIYDLTKKIIELRPNFKSGKQNNCLKSFHLYVDILKNLSKAIQTLINTQIYTQKSFGLIYGEYFPTFEFPNVKTTPYQLSSVSFPYSPYETFPFLNKIIKFLPIIKEITLEIAGSLNIRCYQYQDYIQNAVLEQLNEEMNFFLTNSCAESYQFISKMSEKVAMTMTSPHLNDIIYILNSIHEMDQRKRFKYAMRLREMIYLGWKLEKFLVRSDFCLPIYKQQLNLIKNDPREILIDFAYGDYDFSAISHDWVSDELEKIVTAQHNYNLALETAIRFNNYHFDSIFIEQILEMNEYKVHLPHKAKLEQKQRQEIISILPSLLFYEPDLISPSLYPNAFCYISAVSDFLNCDKLINAFIPFSLRSELTFIAILERNFLHHYSNYEVFTFSSPKKSRSQSSESNFVNGSESNSENQSGSNSLNNSEMCFENIIDSNNNLNHFIVPTIPQCLSIDKNREFLQNLMKFLTIRYQLLKYMQHDSYLAQAKPRTVENIYNDKVLWISPFFSRINVEMKQFPEYKNLEFSMNYFNVERETYCSKQVLVAIALLELSIRQGSFTSFTSESAKSYLLDINKPPIGNHSFMSDLLYSPFYLNQFWYQCNDQFRSEYSNHQSITEQTVDDSIVGFKDMEYRIAAHEFSVNLLRFSFMRLGYYVLLKTKNPKDVNISSSIKLLNHEIWSVGNHNYDNKVNIKATSRIGSKPTVGTIETRLLEERFTVLLEVMAEFFTKCQIEIIDQIYEEEIEKFERSFSVPTSLLKPDCYSKRMQINTPQVSYIPPISSLKEQFVQEVRYARSRFVHSLFRYVSLSMTDIPSDNNETSENTNETKENDSENFDLEKSSDLGTTCLIRVDDLKARIKELSVMLDYFLDISGNRLRKTWAGFLQNGINETKGNTESQILMNLFVKNFILKYNRIIIVNLATKLKDQYLQLAHLRDKERVINQEQERFEKMKAREYRAEFDCLIKDLKEEIRKAKLRFVKAKNSMYDSAGSSVGRYNIKKINIDEQIAPLTIENSYKLAKTPKENSDSSGTNSLLVQDNPSTISPISSPLIGNSTEINTPEPHIESLPIVQPPTDSILSSSNQNYDNSINMNESFEALPTQKKAESPISSQKSLFEPNEQAEQNQEIGAHSVLKPNLNALLLTEPEKSQQNDFPQTPKIPTNSTKNRENSSSSNVRWTRSLVDEFPSLHDEDLTPQARNRQNLSARRNRSSREPGMRFSMFTKDKRNSSNGNFPVNEPNSRIRAPRRKSIARSTRSTPREKKKTAKPEPPKFEFIDIDIALQPTKEKQPKVMKSVTEKIEDTKKKIEDLEKLRKMLRITTTISGIAVKKIYSRMIKKVAEEKKSFSAMLWHGKRLFEEDMAELNEELRKAYSKLTNAEIEIENLHVEIEESKRKTVKLLHWKEMNLRQIDNIHKELRKLTNVGDVNITQLLTKINARKEELELLEFEHEKLEEEIYYQVKEPMMELDEMRREISYRKATCVRRPKPQEPPISMSDQVQNKVNEILEMNKMLTQENEEIRMKIYELENQIQKVPEEKQVLIDNLFESDMKPTRSKSNRTGKRVVVKPEKTRFSQSGRPGTSRY
ncbi:hypothetical protein TRFO_29705 [Tritrichomonas foetus]|uniref:Uncharacterized protein n=1 Tax=Tritrichomonas foetus TaxID=1144522 RepID=A0A1J4JWB2_9EUKA|nr:hypothetical protein TRFO_29705 [Tritrichomonas foetus]|eukprot:OHT03002.1 hypothetical protein TRFO_29705 [Tritrichomonas foetus]